MHVARFLTSAILALSAAPAVALTSSATFILEVPSNQQDCSSITNPCLASLPSSFTLVDNGLTASFSGKTFDTPFSRSNINGSDEVTQASVVDSKIGRYVGGAGVANSISDAHTVDSGGRDDFVEVSFSENVVISSISFGFFSRGSDNFRLLWDTSGDGAIGNGDRISGEVDIPSNGVFSSSQLANITNNVFGIGAFDLGRRDDYDEWKLRSMTVHYEMTPIPLPASAVLLIAAVGGFAAFRKRAA